MQLIRYSNQGVFPGRTLQLFSFENPVNMISESSCMLVPCRWGLTLFKIKLKTKL